MTLYIQSTIFTNYAFNKAHRNLIGDYEPYNFTLMKISNEFSKLDPDATDLANVIYDIPIEKVEVTGNNIFTLYATIPPMLEGFKLWQIGIYDRSNNKNNLFAYANIKSVKPKNLSYELTLKMEVNLENKNFYPSFPDIEVVDTAWAKKEDMESLSLLPLYIATNLERVVEKNSNIIGFNKPQVFYSNEELAYRARKNAYCVSEYTTLKNYFRDNLKDTFYNIQNNSLHYGIRNLYNFDSYLSVFNSSFYSNMDTVNFNNTGGSSLSVNTKINSSNTLILNKGSKNDFNSQFDFYTQDGKIEFKLNSPLGYYKISYEPDEYMINNLFGTYNLYTITYNGLIDDPKLSLYINSNKVDCEESKLNYNNLLSCIGMNLSNQYSINYQYDFLTNIDSLFYFNKVLSDDDVFYLHSVKNTSFMS